MAEETVQRKPHRKQRLGVVVSDKMQKTIVVRVERRVKHPLYKKVVRKFKKFHAHDEKEEAKAGDVVRIVECRPLSKTKCWRLAQIVRRGEGTATHA
ncbi:MAG: 30S ribosomal protein S17 [Verrucomicrobia bacterium]|nr:30S ribosomal protein S17 [Verrucomicrobiota bacterium]